MTRTAISCDDIFTLVDRVSYFTHQVAQRAARMQDLDDHERVELARDVVKLRQLERQLKTEND